MQIFPDLPKEDNFPTLPSNLLNQKYSPKLYVSHQPLIWNNEQQGLVEDSSVKDASYK